MDVDLDEGAGELLLFPRSCRLAGAQTHDDVLPPDRLAGMERHVLDDAVALVEDAEHGDALRHRGDATFTVRCRRNRFRPRQRLLLTALAASDERKRGEQGCVSRFHAYSGIQGS